jgi:DNA helicase-2/ATP-dependent DNA helicase PcrA
MSTTPNPQQDSILASKNPVILIKAVAGAGKTTTLAMLAHRAVDLGVRPGSIIALCFSTGARLRFREKLREQFEQGASVYVWTIDDFARSIIESLAKKGFLELPALRRDTDSIRSELVAAAARVWQRYEERGLRSDFNFALDENNQHLDDLARQMAEMKASLATHDFAASDFSDEDVAEFAEELDRPGPEVEIIREYEAQRHPYPDELRWQGPHDAVGDLVFILKQRPDLLAEVFKWSLCLVDEWHDINGAEFALLQLLRRDARLVVVGDENQTINVGRGAHKRYADASFRAAFPDAAHMGLGMSYRFGKKAAEMADTVVGNGCTGHPARQTTVRREYYDPGVYGACAERVAAILKATRQARGAKNSDFAIILRDVDQCVEIEAALMEAGIPYKCDGVESFLLLPEILMLRGLLHYVSGSYDSLRDSRETCEPLVLALSRYFYVTRDPRNWEFAWGEKKSVLRYAQDEISKHPETLKSFFEGTLLQHHDFDSRMARQWKVVAGPAIAEMAALCPTHTAAQLLAHLRNAVNLADATSRAFVSRDRADSARRSLAAFFQFADKHGNVPVAEFLQKIRAMQNAVSVNRKSDKANTGATLQRLVRVSTIHAAKGREWKYVLMPYMEQGEFARSADAGHELRCLYVGLTRVMGELILFEPDEANAGKRIARLAA